MALHSAAAAPLSLLVLAVCLAGCNGGQVLAYYPVEYLRALLPCPLSHPGARSVASWGSFVNASATERENMTATMAKNLKEALPEDTTVLLSKGTQVLVEKLAPGLRYNSTVTVSQSYLLSLIGMTLPIIFEDYSKDVVTKPIGDILRGDDRNSAKVKKFLSTPLYDLVVRLGSIDTPITDSSFFSTLKSRGIAAYYVINTLLGASSEEVWPDAFFSVGIDEMSFTTDARVKTSLDYLRQSAVFVTHELHTVIEVPKIAMLEPDQGHFLFNWWLNCPHGDGYSDRCLVPTIPSDAVFSVSPKLRVYTLPSLELSLVVLEGKSAGKGAETIEEALRRDSLVWKQIITVFDPSEDAEDETVWSRVFSVSWPVAGFVAFVMFSHIWVYWLCHGLWYVVVTISKRAYAPRPKMAKQE